MASIQFRGISKSFRRKTVLSDVDLTIRSGSFTVVTGPPESGKSVLGRILIGLDTPDSGSVLIDGMDVTNLDPGYREIGYVPQSFALFPHMSVFDNIAYALKLQGADRGTVDQRVRHAADLMNIAPLLDKRPQQLSGGEKQRVALARGLTKDSHVYILDDPLVGLDFKRREQLMEELREMQARLEATFFYVTADPLEALTLADDLVVLDGGRVTQSAGIEDVYDNPATFRTMDLIGFPRCNALDADLARNGNTLVCRSPLGTFSVDAGDGDSGDGPKADGPVTIGLRAEYIQHRGEHDAAAGTMPTDGALPVEGKIYLVEDLGSEYVVYFTVADKTLTTTISAMAGGHLKIGDPFPADIVPDGLYIFDSGSGRFIGRGVAAYDG